MPIYLCKPGSGSPEPWRHGVPVYALPFPLDNTSTSSSGGTSNSNANANAHTEGGGFTMTQGGSATTNTNTNTNTSTSSSNAIMSSSQTDSPLQMHQYEDVNTRYTTHTLGSSPAGPTTTTTAAAAAATTTTLTSTTTSKFTSTFTSMPIIRRSPIRRVKHAEVVLVDEVSVHYGNFWLRLRWPGKRGGVAGYIALGGTDVVPVEKVEEIKERFVDGGHGRGGGRGGGRGRAGGGGGGEKGLGGAENEGFNLDGRGEDAMMDMDMDMDMNMGGRGDAMGAGAIPAQDEPVVNSSSYNSDHEPSIPEEEGDDLGLIDLPARAPTTDLHKPLCESTGLYFPSTAAMELLPLYDDGLSPSSLLSQDGIMDDMDKGGNGGEPIFCRICRDGLHDIDYDFGVEGNKNKPKEGDDSNTNAAIAAPNPPAAANAPPSNHAAGTGTGTVENIIRQRGMNIHASNITEAGSPAQNNNNNDNDNTTRNESQQNQDLPFMMQNHLMNATQNEQQPTPTCIVVPNSTSRQQTNFTTDKSNNQSKKAPIKAEDINHPYSENPLLAPCECSGSMAFVHYLCIEQWRCRSHHPAAKNGLNCETCNAAYTLPPPPSRPDTEEEDWLEAMPPHVLAALRHPHPCWQIGAAIVRRRWLRPIAPVLTSPIVALYCRARRTLKKRGVSRRRWACSLCRRRARWKCVRCLRSYYCSRQCQNVSWHIVHKHVCYKPARFWWSVVVYGCAYIYFIPGVLSYPLIYDLGLGLLWLSFVLMGVIGGGIATIMKREMGIDIRGRSLEVAVVIMTIWMGLVCWGLVWEFFGEADQCIGVMDKFDTWQTNMNLPSITSLSMIQGTSPSREQRLLQNLVLKPAKTIIDTMDQGLLKTGPMITGWICTPDEGSNATSENTCLEITRNTKPDFMLPEQNGQKCASDFNVITFFCYLAVFIHVLGTIWKRRDRGRRARHHHNPRPHQD
mmetsp:Transcript_9809/g.14602  ORF Transcript_9809/g.14602 Transcript_9809/m.14602 type:complete len:956 (-) Transcript_9809:81-2948(-)